MVSQIRSMDSLLPVLVMTAWSSVDLAVEAMRRGALDFTQKPWENHDLLQKLHTQLSGARARRRAQRQRDEELQEAREIQDSLLPKTLPEVAGYEVAATTQPLRFVGGDYYSVVRISDRHTVLCIADVAGKGLPGALLTSSSQAALQPLISQRLAPRERCQRLNRVLGELTPVGSFISFFYAVRDCVDNRLTYCNAGHNPPLLIGRRHIHGAKGGRSGLGPFPTGSMKQSGNHTIEKPLLIRPAGRRGTVRGTRTPHRIARENPTSSAREFYGLNPMARHRTMARHLQDDASLIVVKEIGGGMVDLDNKGSMIQPVPGSALCIRLLRKSPDSPRGGSDVAWPSGQTLWFLVFERADPAPAECAAGGEPLGDRARERYGHDNPIPIISICAIATAASTVWQAIAY